MQPLDITLEAYLIARWTSNLEHTYTQLPVVNPLLYYLFEFY